MNSAFLCYSAPMALLSLRSELPTHISLEPLQRQAQNGGVTLAASAAPHPATRPGRRVTLANQVLRLFQRLHSDKKQQPKLENLRYTVLRTLRKALKRIQSHREIRKNGLFDFDYDRFAEFASFCGCVRTHSDAVQDFLSPKKGPKVDNMRKTTSSSFLTYNGKYLQYIFSSKAVKAVYREYVALLCSDFRPNSLCKRFRMLCCTGISHSERCAAKWTELKQLLEDYMGADLSVQSAD